MITFLFCLILGSLLVALSALVLHAATHAKPAARTSPSPENISELFYLDDHIRKLVRAEVRRFLLSVIEQKESILEPDINMMHRDSILKFDPQATESSHKSQISRK